ncbi:MAG: strawberry notch family protein [Clostridia bacterium]|nr:strawberry notch family protein [Clostridia bacterium]
MASFKEFYEKRTQAKMVGNGGSFREWYQNRGNGGSGVDVEKISGDIRSRVNTWLQNNDNFVSNYNYRYYGDNSAYRGDSEEWLSTITKQKQNFDAEADRILSLMETYKAYLGEDYIKNVTEALNGNREVQAMILDFSEKDGKYWAQFGSAERYNDVRRQQELYSMSVDALAKHLDSENSIAYTTLDGRNLTWQALYESKKKEEDAERLWSELSQSPNFDWYAEKGALYRNPSVREAEGFANIFGWRPGAKDVPNIVTYSRENAAEIGAGELIGTTDMVGDARYSFMTDREVSIYNYYLGKFGKEKADAYLKTIDDDLTERYENRATEAFATVAKENPVALSAFSVPMGLFSGAEYLKDSLGYAKGEELDSNFYAGISQAIRGSVSEQVDWDIGSFDAFDFLYNTGMSTADSLTQALTLGSGGALTLGLSAAAQATNDALERGLSDKKAFENGFFAGSFEAIFEKVSIGNFKALQEVPADSIKDIAKNIGKSMLVNASEETFTELANIAYDTFVNGDFSSYETKIRQYMTSGMSESEAKRKVALELGAQIAEAGASGALMGLGFGTVGSGMSYGKLSQTAKNFYNTPERTEALIAEALALDPNNKFVKKMQAKVAEGKTLTGGELLRLIRQKETAYSRNIEQDVQEQTETFEQEKKKLPETSRADSDVQIGEDSQTDEKTDVPAGSNEKEEESSTQKESATAVEAESKDDGWQTATLDSVSKKYGEDAAEMRDAYIEGQDITDYDLSYQFAYDAGMAGVPFSLLEDSEAVSSLFAEQKKRAYNTGAMASMRKATAQDSTNRAAANGKSSWRRGTVKGEGISLSELKTMFHDTENTVYKILDTYAEVTGLDIVIYRSDMTGEQGHFDKKSDTVYLDVNAGLTAESRTEHLSKYTMLRTFSHEFTHFLEKWNPMAYNDFRKVVLQTLSENGEDISELIAEKQTDSPSLTYDEASREVVAEAMTDILPDAHFIETLAEKHQTVFEKLLGKLKEFLRDLKTHFRSLAGNLSREANALKRTVGDSVAYLENIVKMFDEVAVEAVETYQRAVATDEQKNTEEEQKNGTERTEEEGNNDRRTETSLSENQSGRRYEDENGSQVSETLGEENERRQEVSVRSRFGIISVEHPFGDKAYVTPEVGSYLQKAQSELSDDYGVPCYIVNKDAWTREAYASTHKGRVFVSEAIDEDTLKTFVSHEATHFMKQYGFAPYLGFIEATSDSLNFDFKSTRKIADLVKKHIAKKLSNKEDTDITDMTDEDRFIFYDELNAFVYGLAKGGIIGNEDFDYDWVKDAFLDFDGYIGELSEIHERFKAEHGKKIIANNSVSITEKTASEKLADMLLGEYLNDKNLKVDRTPLTSKALYLLADQAFGGTQAEGAYNRKDAYDAMELAVNQFLFTEANKQKKIFNSTAQNAVQTESFMEDIVSLLPTQNVRTQEMEDFQQFSTPPSIAYLAAWVANIFESDFVLEPSAGIGGLAVFAKAWGATVAVNELSDRRFTVLSSMGFDHVFRENAEHIDDVLPDEISPSVVIMNPPFSSTAGRTKNNKTSNAEKHIDSALARLRQGGRLVAILGKGMNNEDYKKYWDKLRKDHSIRANLSIDGENYKKYGTAYGVQLVVIDKTGAQTGETLTGKFTDLTEIPKILEEIRNDRQSMERSRLGSGENSTGVSVFDGGDRLVDGGHLGSDKRTDGSTSRNERKGDGERTQRTERARNRTDAQGTSDSDREKADGKNGRGMGEHPSADSRNSDGADKSNRVSRSESELSFARLNEDVPTDDGVYASFVAPDIPLKGGKKHPAVLVESAAMAAVSMPTATYAPKLPADVVKNTLSDAQLVTVTYAGQAHEQKLPDGRRKGFFIGDGTGVGKGRQIAGIILDNFMQGRKKAVWISKNNDLYGDAIRDWTATTGRSQEEVINHSKIKSQGKISLDEGILYSTYDTLKSEKGGNRLEQIVEWLGEDFDGVIAFDEAHNMGNLFGKRGKFGKSKGSEKAKAGVELQRRLPNARIVYVSATAATEVENLAYAERIGLWGQGTSFINANDFISKIGASGLAAMELVIRDMKAMGSYVARSISYNGVNYETVEHGLTSMQTEIYNTMSRAWQKTMSNVHKALESTGGKYNSAERQRALGNYYSSMQRFYNQVLTSMAMPSVIADMRKELDAGRSCVLQIVNTNEAQQNKQLAEAKASGESLDNLDLTPREALVGYLMTAFPTQMFEEYTDDDGNLRSRPVMNSKGEPVQSKEAIRQRDALIEEVNQMSIPDGPLEMLFDAFGTEAIAENTGRSRRVVPKKMADGSVSRVEERRTLNHRTADVQAFQDGKKRILVFSDAGGTGKSYHASLSEKNRQQRVHYVLQPGWVASNAVQGFGRTHRSNEASAPIYKLVTTNIKGQKRFTSTIARRLDQLGALTKGQRDTGSGMFGAKDNLETDLAKDSLREFYKRLGKDQIDGINGMKTLERLGLKEKFSDEYGAFKLNDVLARDISTFLNRILALEVDEQNTVFDAFISIYETELDAAIAAGTLDTGMENVKADKIEIVDDKIIRKAEHDGASTHYIQAKIYTKPKVLATVDEVSKLRSGFEGIYKTESGAVKAVFRIADKTTEWGAIQKQYRLISPNFGAKASVWSESTLKTKSVLLDRADWQKAWDAEVSKVPAYNEDTLHMLTGALLPIWNTLPQEGNTKVKRLIAGDGTTYLGRVIEKDMIDSVLGKFSMGRTKETFTAKQVMEKAIKEGVRFQLMNNRAEIFRSRVSGEWRLEISQQNAWYLRRMYPDVMQERIGYNDRYFIPVGDKGIALLEKLLLDNPVRNTVDADEQYQQRRETLSDSEVLEMAADTLDTSTFTDGEKDALAIFSKRNAKLRELEEKRAELGKLYKAQQFTVGGDRKAAMETLNRMHVLDGQIQRAANEVLSVEDKAVLHRVLHKARLIVEAKEREHGKIVLENWRARRNESAAVKKYRSRIFTDAKELTEWILHPDNKNTIKHIPDVLKDAVIPFLMSIDMTSKSQLRGEEATKADLVFQKRLQKLSEALPAGDLSEDAYHIYDLPTEFFSQMKTFIGMVDGIVSSAKEEYVLNVMNSAQLRELSHMLRALKKAIKDFNQFHANEMFRHVYEAGEETIGHLQSYKDKVRWKLGNDTKDGISNFLYFKQMRPSFVFERMGKGAVAIEKGLRKGQAKLAFNMKAVIDFAEETYSAKEVKTWEKEKLTLELSGGAVEMTVSQAMSFYLLSKRPQAKLHLFGKGFRVANQNESQMIDENDLFIIENALTPREREVADSLQKFMATVGAKWGNEVTLARFGEEQFGRDEHYFPIASDGRYLNSDVDKKRSDLYALLNMSFTQAVNERAQNQIVLHSVFDVFANHMADMGQYNALALPVLDAVKWLNYQQTNGDSSVKNELSRVFGSYDEHAGKSGSGYAVTFITNILKDFNGVQAQGAVPSDKFMLKMLDRSKIASVAYNVRVVLQQPVSITRAGLILNPTSIIKGLSLHPVTIKRNIEEMRKYSGIALWKSFGFYDVDVTRSVTELIRHDESLLDKFNDFGMRGAETADTLTWAAIWNACKQEVVKTHGMDPSSEKFFKAVTNLFEDVIYKTQVVDSILTKNEYLRSQGFGAKTMGAFMSESTTTASMALDSFDKLHMEKRKGTPHSEAWEKHGAYIGRAVAVYAVGQILVAAMQSVVDAFRDDDEYQSYPEKYLEAFIGNVIDELMPFNKLPIIKDIYESLKAILSIFGVDTYGRPTNSVFANAIDYIVDASKILNDKINGTTNYTDYGLVYKLLQAASALSGIPLASISREITTALNNTVGVFVPRFKIKTYDPPLKTQLKYAYEDGYLSSDEAYAELLALGLDEKELASALRKALRAYDSRIHEAAVFRSEGNIGEYERIVYEILDEGRFSQDIIVGAIHAEQSTLESEMETDEKETTDKAVSIYTSSDLNDAFDFGDNELALKIIDDLIATKIANGKTEKEARSSVRSAMTSYWKPLYIEAYKTKDSAELERIRRILYASGLYGKVSDVIETARNWLKDS